MEHVRPPATTASDIAGQRIRAARERRSWTVQQLSDACSELGASLSRHTIHDIERGRPRLDGTRQRQITLDEWLTLAEALSVPPAWLIAPLDGRDELATAPGSARGPLAAIPWLTGERAGKDLAGGDLEAWKAAHVDLALVVAYVRQLATIEDLIAAGPNYAEDVSLAARRAKELATALEDHGITPATPPRPVNSAIMHG